jgi:hypothetical protein
MGVGKLAVWAVVLGLLTSFAVALWMLSLSFGFGLGYRNPVFDAIALALTWLLYGLVGLWCVTVATGIPLAIRFRDEPYLRNQWPLWVQPPVFLLGVYLFFEGLVSGFALEQLAVGALLFYVGNVVMIWSAYRKMEAPKGGAVLMLPVLLMLAYPFMLWHNVKIWREGRGSTVKKGKFEATDWQKVKEEK